MLTQIPVETMTPRPLLLLNFVAPVLVLIFLPLPLSQQLLQQLETLLLITKRKSAAIALALEEVKETQLLLAQITNT